MFKLNKSTNKRAVYFIASLAALTAVLGPRTFATKTTEEEEEQQRLKEAREKREGKEEMGVSTELTPEQRESMEEFHRKMKEMRSQKTSEAVAEAIENNEKIIGMVLQKMNGGLTLTGKVKFGENKGEGKVFIHFAPVLTAPSMAPERKVLSRTQPLMTESKVALGKVNYWELEKLVGGEVSTSTGVLTYEVGKTLYPMPSLEVSLYKVGALRDLTSKSNPVLKLTIPYQFLVGGVEVGKGNISFDEFKEKFTKGVNFTIFSNSLYSLSGRNIAPTMEVDPNGVFADCIAIKFKEEK